MLWVFILATMIYGLFLIHPIVGIAAVLVLFFG